MYYFGFFGFFILLLGIHLSDGQAWCPHGDPTLKPWSDPATWGGEVFDEYSNVTITDKVLLDTSIEVFSITISPGGMLVWSPDLDIYVTVHYILVEGSLIIGSEDCPYPAHTEISFAGLQNEYDIPNFHEKFLGVAAGGTLEVHGEERLGWTKLTSTLEKCESGSCLFFEHQNLTDITFTTPGLVISVFETDGQPIKYEHFRLDSGKQKNINSTAASIEQFFDDVPDGKIVTVAVQRYIAHNSGNQYLASAGLFDLLEDYIFDNITGSLAIRNIEKFDAYTLAFVQGRLDKIQECLVKADSSNEAITSKSALHLHDDNLLVEVESFINPSSIKASFVNIRTIDLSRATPVLELLDDAASWRPGDTVIITSTDYDWEQVEYAGVIHCPYCSNNQIRVKLLPEYTHYGEVYKNTDMRAEVALLTRNIVFAKLKGEQGNTQGDDVFGGHIKILKDFESVHIEGAEFVDMGQQTALGRYPIHFHMCEDVDTQPNPPYIRSNSIHHSYARCITVHGTSGLEIEDNVCFESLGHGYFLEDGGEKRTVFNRNLGLGQRKAGLIFTDSKPVTFFITNPQTYLRNNVAAGGLYAGYWFMYPDEPIGPSQGLGFMAVNEAKHTAIYEFYNNVAHSYDQSGLLIDNTLTSDGKILSNNNYEPWNDPLNSRSGAKEVFLTRFTGYKNKVQNAFISGGYITMVECSFSDSASGVVFERSSDQWQTVHSSVFIGESPNLGLPSQDSPRSRPSGDPLQPVQGLVLNDGPVNVQQSWFGDFIPIDDQSYRIMGLGFMRGDSGPISPRSFLEEVSFGYSDPSGYRIYDGNDTIPGFSETNTDLVSAVIDSDGSLSTLVGNTVVKPSPFHLTSSCVVSEHWGLGVCPQQYGQLTIAYKGNSLMTMTRDDDPSLQETASANQQFLVIKAFVTSYILHFGGNMPSTITITGTAIDKPGGVRIGVCVPRDAVFDLKTNKPKKAKKLKKWTAVSSVAEVDSDTKGARYYFDADVGIIFFKLFHSNTLSGSDAVDCPKNICPFIQVKIKRGDLSDSDCLSRAYPKYERSINFPLPTISTFPNLPEDSMSPPESWGAGPTKIAPGEETNAF